MATSSVPTYGPLPDRCKEWFADGDIVLMCSSAKVSQISATNADVQSVQDDRNSAIVFQLFLQLVTETFEIDQDGGGAFFFTRVDRATLDLRTKSPYSPLSGPHQMVRFPGHHFFEQKTGSVY